MCPRPIVALTLGISQTYRAVQTAPPRQAIAATAAPHQVAETDDHGYLVVRTHDLFGTRYLAEKPLGQGSFGRVILARTQGTTDEYVAIKIMKSGALFHQKGEEEAEILRMVTAADPELGCRFISSFLHGDHFCIAMEVRGSNLYHILKATKMRGFPLQTIRIWAWKLLKSFVRLKQDDLRLIHTDCKPENILVPFRDTNLEDLRIADFGSAVIQNKGRMYSYVQSRYYRSPEVLFGQPYSFPIDAWSVGTILFEMHTGKVLFRASSSNLLCYMFVDVLGFPPRNMLFQNDALTAPAKRFFVPRSEASLELVEQNKEAFPHWTLPETYVFQRQILELGEANRSRLHRQPLAELIRNPTMDGQEGHSDADYERFAELLTGLLQYDPQVRWSVERAFESSFVQNVAKSPV